MLDSVSPVKEFIQKYDIKKFFGLVLLVTVIKLILEYVFGVKLW